MKNEAERFAIPLLALLFLLSGFSALIYQVIWLRLLALVFGVTVYAASAVLASFMGGLALGSWAGGRLAPRTSRRSKATCGGIWRGERGRAAGLRRRADPPYGAAIARASALRNVAASRDGYR